MHLMDCEHPVRVYNKYLGEFVWTRCGHCNCCKRHRSSRWVARLEMERSFHAYSAFITLTYNDQMLPRLELRPYGLNYPAKLALCGVRDCRDPERCIPFEQLEFTTPLDKEYFNKRIELDGSIPYANFRDIQLYHKRLNKIIHDEITQKYNNFRFFTVSEFGSTSHRPHFHEILFFDDPKIAERLAELVYRCWCTFSSDGSRSSNGFIYCELVEKSANSYVAQYLNQLFDLPSFYQHSELRPKFVCSKRPAIGSGGYSSKDIQEIFDSESPTVCVRDSVTSELKDVPLLPCIKSRLFPRLAFFEQIYHSLRVKLYGIAFVEGKVCQSFESFLRYVYSGYYKTVEISSKSKRYLIRYNINHFQTVAHAFQYMIKFDHAFGKVPHAFLRRLYYISKRVLVLCRDFGLTVEQYVQKLERFYSRCELSCLKSFYDFQSEYSKSHLVDSLVWCYPEFAYQNSDCDFIPLENVRAYTDMVLDSALSYSKVTKSHFKNAYIEASSATCEFFKFLIYYYAQKCNENLQAFSQFGSERLRLVT